jgi:hypothetical protein
MKFIGGCEFGRRLLAILCRAGLLISCDQFFRIEHVDREQIPLGNLGIVGIKSSAADTEDT